MMTRLSFLHPKVCTFLLVLKFHNLFFFYCSMETEEMWGPYKFQSLRRIRKERAASSSIL